MYTIHVNFYKQKVKEERKLRTTEHTEKHCHVMLYMQRKWAASRLSSVAVFMCLFDINVIQRDKNVFITGAFINA